jgi:alanine dehydrogenase
VVAGRATGRTSKEEITLFDSTGIAVEDAAAAALVYDKALQFQMGKKFSF